MYTVEMLKSIAEVESEHLQINWDQLDVDAAAREKLESSHKMAIQRIVELEPIYTKMRSEDTRVTDECWFNEELDMCIHTIEDALVDAYCMVNIWERYHLITSITNLSN